MKKILSIDGGGIRGIIPGQVLISLEEKLQKKSGNPNARIASYFDFFAGTSTGGILSCIYLCPSEKDPRTALFSAKQAVELYVENGDEIFDVSLWKKIQSGNGLLDEKYEAKELEKSLQYYFKDLRLSQLLKPCVIPAYDIKRRRAHFFAQHDFATKGDGYDFYVRDVCRATTAAPTYFEVALVKAMNNISYPLVDGGVFVNNPALCAYSEIRNSKSNPIAKDMFIVSLGTGSENKPYDYEEAKSWGSVNWVKPLIDMMMAGASETTNYYLTKMFSAVGRSNQYMRIQPANLGNANPDMDDASQQNIHALVEVGKETAQNCDKELDRIADILLEDGPDPVEFS